MERAGGSLKKELTGSGSVSCPTPSTRSSSGDAGWTVRVWACGLDGWRRVTAAMPALEIIMNKHTLKIQSTYNNNNDK